ncbi:MAG TPA: DUF1287 domain-containing protein [Myxococcales bacterium]|nr:DUF1287 domain-containing protein [Myxococcales bacterium]
MLLSLLLLLATPRTLPAAQCTKLLTAARAMVGADIEYEPAYVKIPYPNGDVAANSGVCADVVVRSFRAVGIDLQRLVHEDMERHFRAYPAKWGLKAPDANIDHRRVPNLMKFFERRGKSLPLDGDFRACDVVAWDLGGGVTHIGVVTGKGTVVHHIGGHPAEEDVLHAWTIIGHFAE